MMSTVQIEIQSKFQTIFEIVSLTKRQHKKNFELFELISKIVIENSIALYLEPFGSYTRMCANSYSDYDMLMMMPFTHSPKIQMSSTFEVLQHYLPKDFSLCIDFPAITIYHKTCRTRFDLVPATPVKPIIGKRPELMVMQNENNLMRINPTFQFQFINGTFKESMSEEILIQNIIISRMAILFKYWKSCYKQTINIPSFYFEIIIAQNRQNLKKSSFQENFMEALKLVNKVVKTNEPVDPYADTTKTKSTMPNNFSDPIVKLFRRATRYAIAALDFENVDDRQNAIKSWDKVFNQKFPSQMTGYSDIGSAQDRG